MMEARKHFTAWLAALPRADGACLENDSNCQSRGTGDKFCMLSSAAKRFCTLAGIKQSELGPPVELRHHLAGLPETLYAPRGAWVGQPRHILLGISPEEVNAATLPDRSAQSPPQPPPPPPPPPHPQPPPPPHPRPPPHELPPPPPSPMGPGHVSPPAVLPRHRPPPWPTAHHPALNPCSHSTRPRSRRRWWPRRSA